MDVAAVVVLLGLLVLGCDVAMFICELANARPQNKKIKK